MTLEQLNNGKANERLVAHRGFAKEYPENTIVAIQAAIDAEAKFIEIDIQLTKDKQVVLFHDRDLKRLCRQEQAIHDYTLSELEFFSSYTPDRFVDKFKGEKIPTLIDAISLIKKYPSVTLFIELKRISIDAFGLDAVLDAVLPILTSAREQIVIISFSLDIIEKISQLGEYPVGVVIEHWNEAVTSHYKRIENINPKYFFCDIDSLPKDEISLLDSRIVVYECTDEKRALTVLQQGVDFIETFDIKEMIKKLNAV